MNLIYRYNNCGKVIIIKNNIKRLSCNIFYLLTYGSIHTNSPDDRRIIDTILLQWTHFHLGLRSIDKKYPFLMQGPRKCCDPWYNSWCVHFHVIQFWSCCSFRLMGINHAHHMASEGYNILFISHDHGYMKSCVNLFKMTCYIQYGRYPQWFKCWRSHWTYTVLINF